MGLDDSSVVIPNIDPLPTRFFTSLIWGHVRRDGIDVRLEFSINWESSVSLSIVKYAQSAWKILAYCSRAVDSCDNMKDKLRGILRKEVIQVILLF